MTQLQREDLKALFWDNAGARAVEIQECFKNDCVLDGQNRWGRTPKL